MQKRSIRIVLNEANFRKYKVYCAIEDISMTDQTNILVDKFINEKSKEVKIIKMESQI
jgi:hypothetical protein